MNGSKVSTLFNSFALPGQYKVVWNAENYASGIYFVKFSSDEFVDVQKIMLVR